MNIYIITYSTSTHQVQNFALASTEAEAGNLAKGELIDVKLISKAEPGVVLPFQSITYNWS